MASIPPKKTATMTKKPATTDLAKTTIITSPKAGPKPLSKAKTPAGKTSAPKDHHVGPAVVYTDDQAHCFYVIANSKWDVDKYLMLLGLKVSTSRLFFNVTSIRHPLFLGQRKDARKRVARLGPVRLGNTRMGLVDPQQVGRYW